MHTKPICQSLSLYGKISMNYKRLHAALVLSRSCQPLRVKHQRNLFRALEVLCLVHDLLLFMTQASWQICEAVQTFLIVNWDQSEHLFHLRINYFNYSVGCRRVCLLYLVCCQVNECLVVDILRCPICRLFLNKFLML